VTNAVNRLFQEPNWEVRDLYNAILNALEQLEDRLVDSPRTLDLIAGEISRDNRFRNIKLDDVDKALRELAHASQGLLVLREKTVYINGAYAEIKRRLDGLTGHSGEPRKTSTFRNGFNPYK
jgi:hypothetical protein